MRFPFLFGPKVAMAFAAATLLPATAGAVRLKDLATIRGARSNQLVGYGLVIGLAGTGDKSMELTENSLGLMLKGLGVDLKSAKMEAKNAAAVVCTAILPPFSRQGARLDVTVSSVGSATSLDGGALLMTSLRGPDGVVYAMAQGKIITQKKGSFSSGSGTLVTAQVPQGAILEKEVSLDFAGQKELKYQLHNPDFTTAARIVHRVNEELGGKYASAEDAALVSIVIPYGFEGTPVDFVAQVESLDIEADRVAKVVINQRSGTIVMGENVRVSPVAVAHGNLRIEIKGETKTLGADGTRLTSDGKAGDPFVAAGEANAAAPAEPGTAGTNESSTSATGKKRGHILVINKGASIADIATSLNEIGAGAEDLVSLLQALKSAGALVAEVEIQ